MAKPPPECAKVNSDRKSLNLRRQETRAQLNLKLEDVHVQARSSYENIALYMQVYGKNNDAMAKR